MSTHYTRHEKAGANWLLNKNPNGTVPTLDAVLCVLMDLRDELQTLNRLLGCSRFTNIPTVLDRIDVNTRRPKRRKKRRKRGQ